MTCIAATSKHGGRADCAIGDLGAGAETPANTLETFEALGEIAHRIRSLQDGLVRLDDCLIRLTRAQAAWCVDSQDQGDSA